MDTPTVPLSNHRIPDMPADFYYIPDFITEAEEAALLEKARFPPLFPSLPPSLGSLPASFSPSVRFRRFPS